MSTSTAVQTHYANVDGSQLTIGVIVSTFNDHITDSLLAATLTTLADKGVQEDAIAVTAVPGAFELPLAAQWLIETSDVDAVICLGCVIRGGTPHFDYVCTEAARGIQQVQLDTGIPVVFGVLTTDTDAQATERSTGTNNKGIDAALTAITMANLANTLGVYDDEPAIPG